MAQFGDKPLESSAAIDCARDSISSVEEFISACRTSNKRAVLGPNFGSDKHCPIAGESRASVQSQTMVRMRTRSQNSQ